MVRELADLPNTSSDIRDRLTLVADFDPAGDQPGAIDGLTGVWMTAWRARSCSA